MSQSEYERVFQQLKPALLRMAEDEDFRSRFEADPLEALSTMGIEVSADLRASLQGRTFSEFWESRRRAAESRVQIRDLPPANDEIDDGELRRVVGGLKLQAEQELVSRFAPPYVPVGPVVSSDNIATSGHSSASLDTDGKLKKP